MRTRGIVVLPIVLAAVAACGSGKPANSSSTAKLAPKQAVTAGTKALLDGRDLTMTLRLKTTTAALEKIGHSPGETPVSPQVESALVHGSLTLTIHAPEHHTVGETLADQGTALTAGDELSLVLDEGKGPVAELRAVAGAAYARVDLAGLGVNAKDVVGLTVATGAAPPALRDAALAAVKGEWVGIPAAALTKVIALVTKAAAGANVPAGLLGAGLRGSIFTKLFGDATVSRTSASGDADQLRLSAPLKTVASDLQASVFTDFASSGVSVPSPSALDVPDQTEHIDLTTTDGVLSALDIDVSADATPEVRSALGGEPFVVEATFAIDPTHVAAPAKVTTFDPTDLIQKAIASGITAEHSSSSCEESSSDGSSPVPCKGGTIMTATPSEGASP